MQTVKQQFEAEARQFDQTIRLLIPQYEAMLDAIVAGLILPSHTAPRIADLGCGTGAVAQRVKQRFPDAHLTCIDLSEKMLTMAGLKLGHGPELRYQLGNFETYQFDQPYDGIVSALALHHLVTDADKISFYARVMDALKPGGVFINADLVLGSTPALQTEYLRQWRIFMAANLSDKDSEQKWIAKHLEEDHPASLINHLSWLASIGLSEIDVIWKNYGFVVYGGRKPIV